MVKGVGKYKKAWSWPAPVEDFIMARAMGFTIHVCNGKSNIGDLTIDKYTEADIKADMLYLPLKTGIADTVVCDPPGGIPYHHRARMTFELRRILKLGGILLLNAPWVPRARGLEIEAVYYCEHYLWDLSIVTQVRKDTESLLGDR